MSTRFRFGTALGRYANFKSSTEGLIAESDTTPDVSNGGLFFTNNTSTTVITNFDYASQQNQDMEGKVITLFMIDDSTSLSRGTNLVLNGSAGFAGANNVISMIHHNSAWIELHRSGNQNDVITIQSSDLGGAGTFNAQGAKVVRVTSEASSAAVIRLATGGQQGQELTIVSAESAVRIVTNSSNVANGFIYGEGTANNTTLEMADTASVVKAIFIDSRWRIISAQHAL